MPKKAFCFVQFFEEINCCLLWPYSPREIGFFETYRPNFESAQFLMVRIGER